MKARAVLFLFCIFGTGTAFGQGFCPLNPPKGLLLMYENKFEPGWGVSGWWGSTTVTETQTPGQGNPAEKSLLINYPAAWGGTGVYKDNLSAYILGKSTPSFHIRKESSS